VFCHFNNHAATLAHRAELNNVSKSCASIFLLNWPFEKSIFAYPQNLWITLWMDYVIAALKWRNIRIVVTLPIF